MDDADGGEPGGNIRQVFLYRTDRGLSFVDRPGGTATAGTSVGNVGGQPQLTYSPGRIDPTNSAFNPSFPSETQRHQQATVVKTFVDQILAINANAKVIVLGDINDFEFSQTTSILTAGGALTLADLLGGRRAALDASIPPAVFAAGWLISGHSPAWGVGGTLAAAAGVAVWRWYRGAKPRAVLLGVLGVLLAVLVVLRTGRAADFILVQIVSNAASALAWTVSIALRWPLLGLVVGTVLGQRAAWRRDPALLRAYCEAGWVWVAQYVVRIAVLVPLWAAGQVVALGVARLALSWPLITVCLAASWWVIRRALPLDHPGLRHPVPITTGAAVADRP